MESFAQGGILRFEFGVTQRQCLDVVGVGGDGGACLSLLCRVLRAQRALGLLEASDVRGQDVGLRAGRVGCLEEPGDEFRQG
ncbi:hypothetical protein ACH47Z_44590 [Streptomyces sp. NPDC020192]|uniref:hypothetical protein n=1 Tax=Streptomyces sp. NPDC020192 TaxID=3365066 RepID=UPI0037A15324